MFGLLTRKLRGDIRAQRAQFVAITVTMLVGVALFGASYDAYRNLQISYDRVFDELGFADRWFVGIGQDAATTLAEVDGVAEASARTVDEVPLRMSGNHVLLGRAVSMSPDAQPPTNRLHLLEGDYLSSADDGVIVEQHAAQHFDLHPGDTVDVLGPGGWITLGIRGVAVSAEYIWPARSRQDLLTAQDDFGVIFVRPDLHARLAPTRSTPEVVVRYDTAATEFSQVDERVVDAARALGSADTYTRAEQPSNAALSEDIQGFGEMAIMFPLLFVSATVMGTYIVLSRLVRAQRPLIGTLLATGFRRRTVFWHYLGYGVVPAAVAGILGIAGGIALARLVTNLYTDTIGLPFRVHEIHALTVIAGLVLALVAGVAAAAPPALAAIALSPAEAMRGSAPPGRGGASIFERVLPGFSGLAIRWRLVVRNVGRQRRRAVYSATGIVLALVLVLVSWGLLDTVQILVDRQFNQIQRWDARVYLDAPPDDAALDRLTAIEGIAAAEPVSTFGVAVSRGDRSYSTELIAYEPDTQMHRFLSDRGEWVELPASGILAGQSLGSVLGVGIGEEATLKVPGTSVAAQVTVAGFVNEPLGTFLYISQDQVAALTAGAAAAAGISTVEVIYRDDTDRAAVRDALMATPSIVAVTDARSLLETLDQFLGLFYAFVGVMLLFGGLMAGALIFTSMTANISERAAELAGLRAAGMPLGTLARLVSVENLVTAALGVPPGLILGYIVSSAFMSSFSSDLFQFDLQMRWTTPILSAAGVLLLALLTQIPALRSLRRLDLGSVLRTRSL